MLPIGSNPWGQVTMEALKPLHVSVICKASTDIFNFFSFREMYKGLGMDTRIHRCCLMLLLAVGLVGDNVREMFCTGLVCVLRIQEMLGLYTVLSDSVFKSTFVVTLYLQNILRVISGISPTVSSGLTWKHGFFNHTLWDKSTLWLHWLFSSLHQKCKG